MNFYNRRDVSSYHLNQPSEITLILTHLELAFLLMWIRI